MSFLVRNVLKINLRGLLPQVCGTQASAGIHTSSTLDRKHNEKSMGPKNWEAYNKKIFPPQTPDEERRPAVSEVLKLIMNVAPAKNRDLYTIIDNLIAKICYFVHFSLIFH